MWTTNLASSPAQVNTDLVHRDPRFPSPSSFPPLKPLPWAWQRAIVCVCVCVLISCFIEEVVFACTDRYSDFLCEKKAQKKNCVNSHESVWEQRVVSGKLPYFLNKNIVWFTGKVQRLNQTEKHVISLFQSIKTIVISCQMFYFYSLTN